MAIQDEPRQRIAGGVVGASLEVDEMAGGERRLPPGDEAGARTEREVPSLARLEQQVVEAIEGDGGGLGRGGEALPCPLDTGPRVVPDHDDTGLLGAADALAGGLGDRVEDGRLIRARTERQGYAVTRRLDLLDRVEAGCLDRRAEQPRRSPAPPDRRRRRRPRRPPGRPRPPPAASRGCPRRRPWPRVRAAGRRCRPGRPSTTG